MAAVKASASPLVFMVVEMLQASQSIPLGNKWRRPTRENKSKALKGRKKEQH